MASARSQLNFASEPVQVKRLAEEEEQFKREKAVGSVDATKPLMAKAAAY
jgi:hypothetical protein